MRLSRCLTGPPWPAAATVRAGEGPYFIEFSTYRFRPHSMFDPELYRSRDEVEEWKRRDPIPTLVARMTEAGLIEEGDLATIEAAATREVERAVVFAEEAPFEPVDDLERDVYTPTPRRPDEALLNAL